MHRLACKLIQEEIVTKQIRPEVLRSWATFELSRVCNTTFKRSELKVIAKYSSYVAQQVKAEFESIDEYNVDMKLSQLEDY